MRALSICGSIVLAFFATPNLHATTIHVPADTSSIQGAIARATAGDTVLVAPGVYHEDGISFQGKPIVVTGTDPGDSTTVAATIVDGDASGSVFLFESGEDSASVLTGLTITNGWSSLGAGIYCLAASPTISRNIIRNNTAPGLQPDGRGGGIYCINSLATISGNIIAYNSSGNKGGGIMAESSSPLIVNNALRENSSYLSGGAIRVFESDARIYGNLIVGNHTEYHGGGISTHVSSGTAIVNNTIVGNWVSYSYGGGGITSTGYPDVNNCIIWDNAPLAIDGAPSVTFSDVQGGFSGTGNIDVDPRFVDATNGNYRLSTGSAAIDSGDPAIEDACLPPGLGGPRSDMGTYGGEWNCGWETVPGIYLTLSSIGPLVVPRGGVLEFESRIWNNRGMTVQGDYWLTVRLPDTSELLIPGELLNYSNPISGQIFPFGQVQLSNQLFVPAEAVAGSYELIGRVGLFPGNVLDESALEFQVTD